MGMTETFLYDAFISYNHRLDTSLAKRLQRQLQNLGKAWWQRRAVRIFRDEASQGATPELWPPIERALGRSRFLIVCASPEAAASYWVDKEVHWWLDNKSRDTLLIAVTAGELEWDRAANDFVWTPATPLPPALKGVFPNEPKWVDFRAYRALPEGDRADDAFLGLAADLASTIRGVPKEDLLSEEVRQQRRALQLAYGAAIGLAVLAVIALLERREAIHQLAETTRALSVANSRQLSLMSQQSLFDSPERALDLAIRAAESSGTIEAEIALARALRHHTLRLSVQHPSSIFFIALSKDGSLVATRYSSDSVRIWSARTGALIHDLRIGPGNANLISFSPDGNLLMVKSYTEEVIGYNHLECAFGQVVI